MEGVGNVEAAVGDADLVVDSVGLYGSLLLRTEQPGLP